MSPRTRRASLLVAVTVLAAGCGSAASQASSPARPAQPLSLTTSLDTTAGTWAVAVMGGSAASHNNFCQLFVRPAGSDKWRLVTPPEVASNGGLVLAGLAAGPVVAGFRPSQYLSYSRLPPPTTTVPRGHPASLAPAWPISPTRWPPPRAAAGCSRC